MSIAERVAARFAAEGTLPKTKYKRLFDKIKAKAIELGGNDRTKKADYWFGLAAKEFGLHGFDDVQVLADWAGERLSGFHPQSPPKGFEDRINEAAHYPFSL